MDLFDVLGFELPRGVEKLREKEAAAIIEKRFCWRIFFLFIVVGSLRGGGGFSPAALSFFVSWMTLRRTWFR